MSKKSFVFVWTLLLTFLTLAPSIAQSVKNNTPPDRIRTAHDTLSFLHITDLHLIFEQETYTPDFMTYRARYRQGETVLRSFLKEIPASTKSEMVIATGDLIDFFEVDIRSDSYLESQVKRFGELLAQSSTPVYCTIGNHDLFSFRWIHPKLEHHQNATARARAYWIRHTDCFRNGTNYSKTIRIGNTTYRLIFLDNGFYQFKKSKKTDVPCLDHSQMHWLKAELQESPDDVEIILMHIPFDEWKSEGTYDNALYRLLAQEGNVKLILAGHLHQNAVSVYPTSQNQTFTQVQTAALAKAASHWRQIRLTENTILISSPGTTLNALVIPAK